MQLRTALDGDERRAAAALIELGNRHEGLDLKLDLDVAHASFQGSLFFLSFDRDKLVGFALLDGAELCGVVHPDHRRRGIGRALLAAAVAAAPERGLARLILIVEEASASGLGFASAVEARLLFAEHAMERSAPPEDVSGDLDLTLQRATLADLDRLAALMAAEFDEPIEPRHDKLRGELTAPGQRFYVATLAGADVGTLKVILGDPRAYIYAFGVVPERRRQGLGRRVLEKAVALIAAEGRSRVALEVETDNAPAIALYRSAGFNVTTTYGYYAKDLSASAP